MASPLADSKRGRDRMLGLVVVATAFMVCLALSLWAKEKSRPETSEPPGPPTTQGIVGYPNAVDAVLTLSSARKLTKRPALRGIVLDGVQSDGTIDVSEGPGRVRYTFQSEAGQGAQPAREPGTLPKRITCGKQNVVLRKEGLVAEADQADYPCAAGAIEALPEPQRTLRLGQRLDRTRSARVVRLIRLRHETLFAQHHVLLTAGDALGQRARLSRRLRPLPGFALKRIAHPTRSLAHVDGAVALHAVEHDAAQGGTLCQLARRAQGENRVDRVRIPDDALGGRRPRRFAGLGSRLLFRPQRKRQAHHEGRRHHHEPEHAVAPTLRVCQRTGHGRGFCRRGRFQTRASYPDGRSAVNIFLGVAGHQGTRYLGSALGFGRITQR